jgi:hypothetical protein
LQQLEGNLNLRDGLLPAAGFAIPQIRVKPKGSA